MQSLLNSENLILFRGIVCHEVLNDFHHTLQRAPCTSYGLSKTIFVDLYTINSLNPSDETSDFVILNVHVIIFITSDDNLQQILQHIRLQIRLHLTQYFAVVIDLLFERLDALTLRLRYYIQCLLNVFQTIDRLGKFFDGVAQTLVFASEAVDFRRESLVCLLKSDDVGEASLLKESVWTNEADSCYNMRSLSGCNVHVVQRIRGNCSPGQTTCRIYYIHWTNNHGAYAGGDRCRGNSSGDNFHECVVFDRC